MIQLVGLKSLKEQLSTNSVQRNVTNYLSRANVDLKAK